MILDEMAAQERAEIRPLGFLREEQPLSSQPIPDQISVRVQEGQAVLFERPAETDQVLLPHAPWDDRFADIPAQLVHEEALRNGYADRMVIAPDGELGAAPQHPGRWVCLHLDPPEAPGMRLEVYGAPCPQEQEPAGQTEER